MTRMKKVLVVGGAGYVGSVLVPKLLQAGYKVRVFDLYLYSNSKKLGEDVFDQWTTHKNLEQIKSDVRNAQAIEKAVKGMDAIIHLACISNDPSFELDRALGKSINYLAFFPFLKAVKKHRTKRLIFASTGSVYGVKKESQVTEDLPLEPLTDYGLYKVFCEKAIADHVSLLKTCWVILRFATVCGYAPRMRLDLTVNILTNLAINKGAITVFGGTQTRPNIHIQDATNTYIQMLTYPPKKIAGQIFNVSTDNLSVMEVAQKVKKIVGKHVGITTSPTDDLRSYRLSAQKISKTLQWKAQFTVDDAIRDLVVAFQEGKIPNSLENPIYYNIKTMQQKKLT